MRALFKTLLAAICMTMILNFGDVLIGSRKFLEEPRIHVVQEGEYFSQLAKDYYGNPEYWRALALVNRAPNVDRIYPGEHVILPDAGTLARIAKSQRMTEVNELVNNQQALAVLETDQSASEFEKNLQTAPPIEQEKALETSPEPEMHEATDEEITAMTVQEHDGAEGIDAYEALAGLQSEESGDTASSGLFWPIAGSAAVLFAAIAFAYRRNKKQQDEEPELDASPIQSFILENENDSPEKRSAGMEKTTSATSDIFKPVRRRNEVENEKDVALTI
ncbi:MAG: LysM peptidoglycan-binding domain-containing protein [Deferribacteres bacterium]|nr:LysM peptidoglycan-binding domain-containing protein [candidate division KSB1 bacterium]MCB9509335.1 LysM peptidoglycan-binding domain-containing protein [Deferribacteres bacterium]